jgi:DNA-binding NarL/FixJ family response regulator
LHQRVCGFGLDHKKVIQPATPFGPGCSGKAGAVAACDACGQGGQHVKSRERNKNERHTQERFVQLSDREREVLGLIVAGLTNKEVGRALEVSPRTAETHRANLLRS